MQETYYSGKLYPLQDKVLEIISDLDTGFYLTGGTALSRVYLRHRFSDDLDFFMNNSPDFVQDTEAVNKKLSMLLKENFKIITADRSFVRSMITVEDTAQKIDFVNDIEYRFGELQPWEKFPRIDHPLNNLSNKISALSRFAEKDVAYILFLSYSFEFNWEFIIHEAQKKDMWVNAIDVSQIINTFPPDKFENIIWATGLDWRKCADDLKIISEEILKGAENSFQKT